MKRIVSLLLIIVVTAMFAGCSANQGNRSTQQNKNIEKEATNTTEETKQPVNIHVIAPAGAPVLSMVKMIEEKPAIVENTEVTYEYIEATDVLSSKLISKEADMAIVPTNLAANLYNKGIPYKLAASSVWGIFYLVSNEEIGSWDDLKGKTIGMTGRGLTPDAIFRYLLNQNEINPDEDLTMNYFAGSTELAADFISGHSDVALVPEPLLTNILAKRKDAKIVMDIQKEWEKATELPSYPQASLIVSEKLNEEHPEIVAAFLQEYEKSIQWINENPDKAGEYYEKMGKGLTANIIKQAVGRCNIKYMDAKDAKDSLKAYLEVLHGFNEKIVGGKLPDEGFYLEK